MGEPVKSSGQKASGPNCNKGSPQTVLMSTLNIMALARFFPGLCAHISAGEGDSGSG